MHNPPVAPDRQCDAWGGALRHRYVDDRIEPSIQIWRHVHHARLSAYESCHGSKAEDWAVRGAGGECKEEEELFHLKGSRPED